MPGISTKRLEAGFDALVEAARAGVRCPRSFGPHSDPRVGKDICPELARLGRIKIEVFGQNFRRITILVGPYAGAHTADPPPSLVDRHNRAKGVRRAAASCVIDANGFHRAGKTVPRMSKPPTRGAAETQPPHTPSLPRVKWLEQTS